MVNDLYDVQAHFEQHDDGTVSILQPRARQRVQHLETKVKQ